MTNAADDSLTARAAARERALELRNEHKKKDRRRRLIVAGSVTAAVLVVATVVTLLTVTSLNARGLPGPANMQSDGIKIGIDELAKRTAALEPGATPVPSAPNDPSVVNIQLYVDYQCAECGAFQRSNGAQLSSWLDSGAVTVEIHPVALLTTKSAGTQYSLRAANAAACVAQYAPDDFYSFHSSLLVDQPQEETAGLSDDELIARAKKAGVSSLDAIRSCIRGQDFKSWVLASTGRALAGPIPNSDLKDIPGPLTVIVNGTGFPYAAGSTANDFAQFVQQASAQTFADTPTPAPTPSETPTP